MAVPAAWPCLSVTRACCALVPARRSYPFATRARSLFLLVCYSYSSRYSLLLLLATPTWRKYEHPRARELPGARPRATPLSVRAPIRPCARIRIFAWPQGCHGTMPIARDS